MGVGGYQRVRVNLKIALPVGRAKRLDNSQGSESGRGREEI